MARQSDREGFIVVDGGLRLHYCEWGDVNAPPVVLVHGANSHLHSWEPIARRLSTTHRVICPDLRGHGESGWAVDGYRTIKFVRDLQEMTRTLSVPKFDLVGHSLGARISIAFAGTHRSMVRHLVLSDLGPETPKDASVFARSSATKSLRGGGEVRGFKSLSEAVDYYRAAHPGWRADFYPLQARHAVRRNWAGKFVFRVDPDLFWINGSAGLRDVPYLWRCAGRIACPTLIMWGRSSPFLNQPIVERMLTTIPNSTLVRTQTGHYIPREDTADFMRLLTAFLADRPAAERAVTA